MQLFFKENVVKMNFSSEDRKLEKQIDNIRTILFQIVEQRLRDEKNTEEDFIHDYITQMKEIDAKIAEAEKEGKPHKFRRITK